MEVIKSKITTNLYTLYNTIANISSNQVGVKDGVQWLNCQPQNWPYTIFGAPNSEEIINYFVEKIKQGHIPPYWIFAQPKNQDLLNQQLKSNGFRLMTQWPGMAITLNSHEFPCSTIHQVTTLEELQGWIDVVNQSLFTINNLHFSTIEQCWRRSTFFRFYIQKHNDKVISTGLAFDTADTAGLYMIATLTVYRGKGLASAMTNHMLAKAKERGKQFGILQATPMGASLYPKLGFKTYSTFNIYWLLGYR